MQSHDAEYRESGEGWATTPKPAAMTAPLSDTRLTFRAEILAALSAAGAFCGECGFQPGETGCADCVRVRDLYADAVMPIVDRLRAESENRRQAAAANAASAAVLQKQIEEQATELDRVGARLAEIAELHEPMGGDCGYCADETGGAHRWPCPTAKLAAPTS